MAANKICAVLAAGLMLAGLLSGCGKDGAETEQLEIPEMTAPTQGNRQTYTVQNGESVIQVSGTGNIQFPVTEVLTWDGGSAQLADIAVTEGQMVKKGDVLMTFVTEADQLALATARMERDRLQREFDDEVKSRQAAIDAKKKEALLLSGTDRMIAEFTAEKLQAELEQYRVDASVELTATIAYVAKLEQEAAANELLAPFDGVIDDIAKLKVDDAVAGHRLIQMHSTDAYLITVKDNSQKLRYNMPIMLTIGKGEGARVLTGRIAAASNILPIDLSQDTVVVKLDEPVDGRELSGSVQYQAQVERIENILVVPRKAIHQENGMDFVYLLENGAEQKCYVSIQLTGTDMVWILDGLEEGQILIVD